jgi:hypothetical protein
MDRQLRISKCSASERATSFLLEPGGPIIRTLMANNWDTFRLIEFLDHVFERVVRRVFHEVDKEFLKYFIDAIGLEIAF